MKAFKGVYKNGTVEFEEPFPLEDGTKVLIIPVTTEELQYHSLGYHIL